MGETQHSEELNSPVNGKFRGPRIEEGQRSQETSPRRRTLEHCGRAAGVAGPCADGRWGGFVKGLGGTDRSSVCWRGLQSVSFWEKSLKGGLKGTLLGCKIRGRESSGF